MRYLMILALLAQTPAVGPCDLGKLVRAVRAHIELEHSPAPSTMLCLNPKGIFATCPGDPTPLPLDQDFQSWEVCGDETDVGWDTFTYPVPQRSNDPKMLREMADCIERRAEKRKRAAKWQEEQWAKLKKADDEFKTELSRCEPKKEKSK